jgi:hypothetical protein
MRRGAWQAVLLVAVGTASPAAAQPLAPSGPPPGPVAPDPLSPALPTTPVSRPEPVLGPPTAVRGYPVRAAADLPPPPTPSVGVTPAVGEVPAVRSPSRGAVLGAPTAASPIPAKVVESAGVRQAGASDSPPATDPVNDLLGRRSAYSRESSARERDRDPDKPPSARSSEKWGEKLEGWLGHKEDWFRSDHCFDGFISPVTNPFLFEDPRSLTEVRPIFLYQKIPGGQPDFGGGHITFFGVQGRLAITERLSFVINKLGGQWFSSGGPVDASSAFSELWLGPKYTFIRNENTGSLLAGGLQFQLPIGSGGGFQNTGSLSLVPYVTYGQNLFRESEWGSFNTLIGAAYAISTSHARSDYLSLSGHLDWDVRNWHRFYPLVEMNYYLYTTNGNSTPVGIEGRDLINFGGQAKGQGLLTMAFGARFKIVEAAQIGTAFEFPIAGPRDLFQYRFTLDFILRY